MSTAAPDRAALLARGLYPYHDGTRPRVGDQLEVQFRLAGACPGGDLAALDALLDAIAGPAAPAAAEDAPPPDPAAPLRAAVELGPIVGKAFDLPPLSDDGVGLSCRERIDLLADFLAATADADASDDDAEAEGGDEDGDDAAEPANAP